MSDVRLSQCFLLRCNYCHLKYIACFIAIKWQYLLLLITPPLTPELSLCESPLNSSMPDKNSLMETEDWRVSDWSS